MRRRLRAALAVLWLVAFLAFLLGPLVVIVGASFGAAEHGIAAFPPTHLTLDWYGRIERDYWEALATSFAVAIAAALAAVVLGIPAALGLARGHFAGKAFASAVFRAPVQIPAVVSGVAFLQFDCVVGEATGWSMGGQQAYHWGTLFPEMVERIAVLCGSARTSPHNKVFLEDARATLTADAAF